MKFRIGTTFILLLGAGMLLINMVLTMFWQRDMLRSDIDRLQTAMAVFAGQINWPQVDGKPAINRLVSLLGAECALVQSTAVGSLASSDSCRYKLRLSELARQAISTGEIQIIWSDQAPHFFALTARNILIAIPFDKHQRDSGAIAIAVPIQPPVKQLLANQKVVFLYILINLLVLTVVGLVRMVKVVIRPIERLARMSGAYTDDEGLNFLAVKEENEFRRLSTSLNQMIERIEGDKNKLKTTVQSLQEANQQLRETQQEMVRTEKLAAVGRLASGLAHEIGNPVGIIQGYLDLIRQEDVAGLEKKDYLDRAEKELQRIGGLIRNLLDFSRPSHRPPHDVSVHNLLTEFMDMFNIGSRNKTADITLQLEAEKDTVFADPDQLRQIFLNCLLNAVDAVAPSSCKIKRITVITELFGSDGDKQAIQWLRVRIQDTGTGIDEVDLPQVFDPFFTTKEPGQGTGLGLFVSHTIVESLGGRMWIASAGSTGTEVVIELPLKE